MGLIPFFGPPAYVRDLNAPLLRVSRYDAFTLSDLCESVLITGATGSGKTTGSGSAIGYAALLAGAGMLITTAKPDDADLWIKRARRVGRGHNLIVIDGSGRNRINFLQYMAQTSPDAGALVMNTVAALATVIAAVNGKADQGGGENQFWQKAMKEALTHSLAVLWAAYGRLNLYDLYMLLQSRPQTYEQRKDPAWLESSFMASTLQKCEAQPVHRMPEMDFRAAFTYLTLTLANPDSRTTGNILATISADLAPLMQGTMRELFCTETTVVPEMTHEGAIIILDLPVLKWGEAGLLAQHIFKYLWQKATQDRKDSRNTRPVVVWCDEAQFFASPHDALFLSISRSARAASVYLTQNLPGLYSRLGPQHHDSVDTLIGNFQTKIFHANTCHRTNQWAAEIIGRAMQLRWNGGINTGWSEGRGVTVNSGTSGGSQGQSGYNDSIAFNHSLTNSGGSSIGYSEQMDLAIQASAFTRLRKGGRANGLMVDGFMLRGGGDFRVSGNPYLPVMFRQS